MEFGHQQKQVLIIQYLKKIEMILEVVFLF